MFKKYTSIENSYRTKFIDRFKSYIDNDTLFIVSEKLDGANIQILFQPNADMLVGKRSGFLNHEDSFFDIWNVLKKYETELDKLQTTSNLTGATIRIFGELYGPGINKRIDYGDDKKIAFFDAYVSNSLFQLSERLGSFYWTDSDDKETLLTQKTFHAFMLHMGLKHVLPPNLGLFHSLEEALNFDIETLQRAGKNGSEGIVIQPYNKIIRAPNGTRLILKKKTAKFSDKTPNAKNKKSINTVSNPLNQKFKQYINKNRVLDTFAKHGEILSPDQMGHYIKLVLEDAKADFLKDNDIADLQLDKKEEKAIYNVGGDVANLLKEYLKRNNS